MADPHTPSPELFFDTVFAHQKSAALRAAVDLDLFTAIGDGANTVPALAQRCKASERGIRILANYMTTLGFLAKSGETYALTPDSAVFLTRRSPAYLGGTIQFLHTPGVVKNFDRLTETVRQGKVAPEGSTVSEENPIWVEFARAMVPMMMPAAQGIAEVLNVAAAGPMRVLDIAAGHGIFGITIAQRNPKAEVVAVDWKPVLAVASENAKAFGVGDRHTTKPGDAFKVDYGTGYDLALLTNFLHHFDMATNVALLKKVAASLKPGGRVAILEFVPNEDRVSPPMQAGFAVVMLAGTESGDAYTARDLNKMLTDAGFGDVSVHPLPGPQTVIVGTKR